MVQTLRVRTSSRSTLFAVTAVTAFAAPASSRAQTRGAFELTPTIDLPVIALTVPVLASWFLAGELRPAWCSPRCDPAGVNAFDRFAAGGYRPAWRTVSDLSVVGYGLAAVTTIALAEGLPRALPDLVVVLESAMVANSLAILTNYATGRPRPYLYGDTAPEELRSRGGAAQSFFSGHTANAFAVTLATFQVLRRTARPAVAWIALAVGLAASSFIATARVIAGDHHPTDVIAGAIVGASVGWLVPALHRAGNARARPAATPLAGGFGLVLTGAL